MKQVSGQISAKARPIFSGECTFLMGAVRVDDIPPSKLFEVAFAGRSNVGKSSLVNALVGRKALAKVSSTPGHTQQLNFFNIAESFILCDMPGYGYAKVGKKLALNWNKLIKDYLRGRPGLGRVYLLIDSRHGLKENDFEVMKMLDESAVSYQIVLTKIDKAKPVEIEKTKADIKEKAKKNSALHPEILISSSETGEGLNELREEIAKLIL